MVLKPATKERSNNVRAEKLGIAAVFSKDYLSVGEALPKVTWLISLSKGLAVYYGAL